MKTNKESYHMKNDTLQWYKLDWIWLVLRTRDYFVLLRTLVYPRSYVANTIGIAMSVLLMDDRNLTIISKNNKRWEKYVCSYTKPLF